MAEGFDSADGYAKAGGRFGALVGRFANRVKDNTYAIDGVTYHISPRGKTYDDRVWNAKMQNGQEPQLILDLVDPDGAMGFPGTVKVTVTYTLTKDDVLRVDYRASTDKDTIISLTNHSYFNMAGVGPGRTVLNQLLTINADAVTATDEHNVPTGEIRPVAGTAFDFRRPTAIGAHLRDPDTMIERARGYDVNFASNGSPGAMRLAASLEDPGSGRVLEEWTTTAGIQVYTANDVSAYTAAVRGFPPHGAVALEAQAFPNAPNIPSFPSAELTPGKPLHEVTEFRVFVHKANPH